MKKFKTVLYPGLFFIAIWVVIILLPAEINLALICYNNKNIFPGGFTT